MSCEEGRITRVKMLYVFVRPPFENNLKDKKYANDFIQRNTPKIYLILTIFSHDLM